MAFKNLQTAINSMPQGAMMSSADEIEDWFIPEPKPKSTQLLPYEIDFLAYTVYRLDSGDGPEIVFNNIEFKLDSVMYGDYSAYTEEANKIRRHFQNKHLMRRLKNREMSEWMRKVDEIVDDPSRLREDSVRVLVKLPLFYKENLIVDQVFKNAEQPRFTNQTVTVNDEFVCEAFYDRDAVGEKEFRVFFKNSKNNVLVLAMKLSESALPLWRHIVKPGLRVRLGGQAHVHLIPGQYVQSYQLSSNHEIEILDK